MPRRQPTSIARAALLTLAGGLVVTAALFTTASSLEYDKVNLAFRQETALRVSALTKGLNDFDDVLLVVNQLFGSVNTLSREQFHSFTAPLLQRYPHVQAFSFQRIVSDAERAEFERGNQRALPGFALRERRDGRSVAAPRHAVYEVIDYVEPMDDNAAAIGINLGQDAAPRSTASQEINSHRHSAIGLHQLFQRPGQPRSVIRIIPVFRSGMPLVTPAQRQAAQLGSTAVVAHTVDMLEKILRHGEFADADALNLEVYTGVAVKPSALMYRQGTPVPPLPSAAPFWQWFMAPPPLEQAINNGSGPWVVRTSAPQHDFLADHLGSMSTLLGGILFSLLAASLINSQAQRSRHVQWLVDQRTADLKHSNQLLSDDVAARKRTERALQESEQRFRRLVALSSDWYWEQDAHLRFTSITGGFADKANMPPERFLGLTRWDNHADMRESAWGREHIARVQAHLPFADLEYPSHNRLGEVRWLSVNGEPLFDDKGNFKGYRGTGADITERKLAQQRIQHIAHHDVLTGLPNRALLQDRLGQAIAYAKRSGLPLWVMLIDLDRFKFVNDTLGHKAGDLLLTTVATRLLGSLRESDTVARLSGDEFVVLLSQHPEEALSAAVVLRLMHTVAQPVLLEGKEFFVTCSIGVAIFDGKLEAERDQERERAREAQRGAGGQAEAAPPAPSHKLIEHADIAMYSAKKDGRNNFAFYSPAMNAAALERLAIESALRNALARDEFVLHYQPQMDLRSGHIVGMEALIRWRHPELGMVEPERFIGVAEETGLIVPIGAWVLQTACAQAQAWRLAGLEPADGALTMAVNLSARQFGDATLGTQISAVLAHTGLPAACLDLELTESLFMSDITLAITQLHEIKALGVTLSIDDFGTGYSSFSYLRRFPIDVLKIDRAFVNDISFDTSEAPIVDSIIALAHNLKLRVIAEGVETAGQLAYLRSHDCDAMQGYYFSEPVPAAEFEALLRQGAALPPPPLWRERDAAGVAAAPRASA